MSFLSNRLAFADWSFCDIGIRDVFHVIAFGFAMGFAITYWPKLDWHIDKND